MKMQYILVLLSILITTSARASTTAEDLRIASLDLVKEYGEVTRRFLEKNGKEKTITAAQKSIRQTLKDPDSAKFQKVRIVDYEGGKVVCGEVNGKNSYGGYVGYKIFAAGIYGGSIYDTSSEYPDVNAASNAGVNAACGYR